MLSVLHVFEFSQQKLIAQLRCIPFVDIAVDQRRLCSLFKMVLGCFQSPESTFNIVPQFPLCKKLSFLLQVLRLQPRERLLKIPA